MGLNYLNLDARTRTFMAAEIDMDVAKGKEYLSSYLSDTGRADWIPLLRKAADSHTDTWLGEQLRMNARLNARAIRHTKHGASSVRVPHTAHETMSEGEFNRFYIRGLCRVAIEDGISAVECYRAKAVEIPRPESQAKIGMQFDPAQVLADLREHVGIETSSGFPGPNSGLSIKLP